MTFVKFSKIDTRQFPYDEQECELKFGSWTYDSRSISIEFFNANRTTVILDEYNTESNEWHVSVREGKRTERHYAGIEDRYGDLTFYLKLKRESCYYNFILILPTLLLVLLTISLFWLPVESSIKLFFGLTLFTLFLVMLLFLTRLIQTSASNGVPYVGAFYVLSMLLIAVSTLQCVIVAFVWYPDREIGRRWKRIATLVDRIMCILYVLALIAVILLLLVF